MSLPSAIFCRFSLSQFRVFGTFYKKQLKIHAKMSTWIGEKEKMLNMDLSAKRNMYKMKKYTTLDEVSTWKDDCFEEHFAATKPPTEEDGSHAQEFPIDASLNKVLAGKMSIWKGDITQLEIDAIVNAANSSLAGGGGVDGFIHRAAGYELKKETATFNGCKTGDAKISGGYLLPAKYVIHTVGPQNGSHEMLLSCYSTCFRLMKENKLRTVAFPCIATGIYGFPNRAAAHIACATARKFMEEDIKVYDGSIQRVIFCTFLQEDYEIYQTVAQLYFPAE